MDWTEETIARLKELWQQGLSTAEIGRQIGITKNAVVGKAHRLGLPARPSPIRRPGGGKAKADETAVVKSTDASAAVASAAPNVVETAPVQATPVVEETIAAVEKSAPTASAGAVEAVAPTSVREVAPSKVEVSTQAPVVDAVAAPKPAAVAKKPAARADDTAPEKKAEPVAKPAAPRPAFRSVPNPPEPRRRGPSCCWPLGDPGTPGFHFCGAPPLAGKPYCAEHAQLAYVKLRDRRDNVA